MDGSGQISIHRLPCVPTWPNRLKVNENTSMHDAWCWPQEHQAQQRHSINAVRVLHVLNVPAANVMKHEALTATAAAVAFS